MSLVHGGKNYQDTLADIDAALSAEPKLVATGMYKKPTVLALRAKVDVLRGDFKGALDDLAAAVTADPDAYSEVFRSGGVKPEEDTDPTSLNKADSMLSYPASQTTSARTCSGDCSISFSQPSERRPFH